jgi:hypothetical protein
VSGYEDPVEAPAVDWPLAIRVDVINAMLNFEIVDHPVYQGLEIQRFDDAVHGTGLLVMLARTADGKVDVYRQPGLSVNPAGYGLNAGLGDWLTASIEPAELTPTPTGVHAAVRLHDVAGRLIEVYIDDRDGRTRRPANLLAPFGSSIENPASLQLVWMQKFDLVRTSGRQPVIRIDGQPVTIGRLPGVRLHRRHLIKSAVDLWAVEVNPDHASGGRDARDASLVALLPGDLTPRARLTMEPPIPPPAAVPEGAPVRGTWTVGISDVPAVTGGEWVAGRTGDTVEVTLDVTRRWRPRRLPLLMRIVTILAPVFRRWPTTYRWTARITVDTEPAVRAGWHRTGPAARRVLPPSRALRFPRSVDPPCREPEHGCAEPPSTRVGGAIAHAHDDRVTALARRDEQDSPPSSLFASTYGSR